MRKLFYISIFINLLISESLFAQKNSEDSLLNDILSRLHVIDTATIQIKHIGIFRNGHAETLQVHYMTDEGENYSYIGRYKTYYRKGGLRMSAFYDLDGYRQGLKYELYRNGKVKSIIDFGINKNHECCNFYGKWFDKNGLIEMEGQNQNGKAIGIWYFYKNGILDYHIDYSTGQAKKTEKNVKQ